ncbi:1,4-beta-D-glucan cellobiohydrolase-like protein [Pseudovirgaria hyperparasitica]|uniref:Glucanase n=1 Tax=Pseudovirgaria hyperparasitica TaxID=470096 RepID=A0A6A6W0I1_9PEZI|nr:1,4-beta-D-glucan cellobiohydrolase-like protein [Pseudovirgaria hyperparasitica]KAF2756015.1 1,4-beta-D-glucan cellobiohydrolase-like protein [Pseudovirgaria hyperparasitica]
MYQRFTLASALLSSVHAQLVGTQLAETHPGMTWKSCTGTGGTSCTSNSGKVVLDANWRWLHDKGGYTNCYTGNEWNKTACPDNKSCASNCALDGADYSGTYGITTGGDSLKLTLVTKGQYSTNIGSRTYLMESDTKYKMFNLLNNEFTFDVDLSGLPCGLNGALYFVAMDADGGMSKYSTNKAGAKYGTGYCDAQCPRDLKFIGGEGNVEGWTASSNDANAGVGGKGSCCAEMDVWEANSISTAFTPHSCTPVGPSICSGDSCGGTYSADRYAGNCDPDGCDFNSYRMGDTSFYGPGKTVDTKSKMTVVTQFIGSPLTEIKRFYVQNGKTIANSQSKIPNVTGNSITTSFCDAQKAAFGDTYTFKDKGGMASMSSAMSRGMVLVMSLWDDHYSNMLWLDSTYPTDKSGPGYDRGTCSTSSGVPADVEKNSPGASVTFSNIRFGPIGSTFKAL